MKKKVLSLALAAVGLVSFGSMAQTTSTTCTDNSCTTTTCAPANCTTQNNKTCTKGRDGARRAQRKSPFDGLNLTEAQQTKLQELNTRRQANRLEQAKARKDSKQRLDSTRVSDRRNARKEYLEEVKAIIGPDQYVIFLENSYIGGGDRPAANMRKANAGKKMDGNRMARKDKKDGRRDMKAPKAAKATRTAATQAASKS